MFRHQGRRRTLKQNLQIASLLSSVAGIVNVTGYLSIQRLTTNVTGHFAFFINDMTAQNFWNASIFLLYILSFLLGSFISSSLVEMMALRKNFNSILLLPALLEAAVLIAVACFTSSSLLQSANLIACLLLFAMGVQNSFVTKVSNAVVRTTHLTGLFTDLGIELSQLLFEKKHKIRSAIRSTIKLRLYIISFFFLGGIAGGYLYPRMGLNTLLFGAIILLSGLVYDQIRFRMRIARKNKIRMARNLL